VRANEAASSPEIIAKWEEEGRETVDEFVECEDNRATMRMDRLEVLGVVGSRYTPLQNADAFGVLSPLIDSGLARIETAGVLRGGRDVWMLVRFSPDSEIVQQAFASRTLADGGEDGGIIPYAMISNNHAGRRQVQLMETPVRVVCANTLGAAQSRFGRQLTQGRAFQVRHTLSVETKTVEAAQALFKDLTANMETIARQYELLRRTHLDTAWFRKLVLDTAAPIPSKLARAGLKDREKTSREKIEAVRSRLAHLWTKGDGHTGDLSAWEAYNAVTQSVDHDTTLWRSKGGEEGRLAAMFEGRLLQVKQDTLDVLVAHAATSDETAAWRESLGASFEVDA
jgi:phage/plasmid-like protein (TIGR03299 family)